MGQYSKQRLKRRLYTLVRSEILSVAKSCVCGERQEDYGTPESNFKTISKLWNAYLGDNVTDAHDVAMMMALLKIARIRSGRRKEDNYIDLAGYAACGGEIATERGGEKQC